MQKIFAVYRFYFYKNQAILITFFKLMDSSWSQNFQNRQKKKIILWIFTRANILSTFCLKLSTVLKSRNCFPSYIYYVVLATCLCWNQTPKLTRAAYGLELIEELETKTNIDEDDLRESKSWANTLLWCDYLSCICC